MTYLTVGLLLAEETNRGPDYGKASPVGLLLVVLLLIGLFFLVRSMNHHLKKVPQSFEQTPPFDGPQPPEAGGTSPPETEVPPRGSGG